MALVISSTPLDINRAYLFALVGLWTSDWLLTALCLHRVEWKLSTASLSWLRTSLRLQSNRTATHANTERSYFGNEKEQAGRNSSGHTFGRPREEDRSNGLRWPFAMLYLMVRYGALAALALLLHASFVASEITFTPSQHLCERSALGIRIVVGLLITCSTVAFYWSLTCSLRRQAPNPRPRLLIIGLCTLLAGELAVWITFTVLSSAPIQDSVSIVTQCQSSPQSPTLLAALICTIAFMAFLLLFMVGQSFAKSANALRPQQMAPCLFLICLALATQTVALALVALDMDASLQLGVATVASFTPLCANHFMHFAISAGTQQQSSRDHYIQAIRQARPARSRHHQHAVSVDQISAPFTPDTGNDAEFANWSPKPSTAMSKPTTHAFSTRGTFGSSAGHQCETTLRYSRVRPSGWVHPDLGEYRDLDKNLPLTPMSSALGLYLPPSPERMRKDSPQASPPALRKTKSGYSLAATFMTTSSNFDVVGGEEISPDGQRATSQIRQLSSETTRTYLAPSALPATAIKRAAWPNLTLETFDRSQPLQPGLPPRPRSRLYSAEPSGMPTRPTVRHDSFGSKSLPAMSILSCKRKAPPLISPGLLAEISTSREQDYFGKDVAKLDANLRDWPACTSCSRQKYLAGQRVLEREHLGQQVTKEGGNGHGSSHEEPSGVPPSLKTQRTLEKVYTPPRTPPRTPQRSRSSTLEGLQRVSPSSDQFVTPTSTASPFREFFDSNPSHLPQTPSPVRVSMSVVRPIVMVSDSGVSPVSNISVHRSHASDTTPRNSLHGSRYLRSQISQASFSTQRSSAISTLAVHLHHEDLSSDTFGAARDSPVRPLAGWNCAPALEDGATEDEYAYETHQPNASLSPLRRKLSDLFLRSHEGETPASPRTPDTPTKRPIPLPDDPFRAN